MAKKRAQGDGSRHESEGASGFVKGLTELVEKLGELAETGREFARSGEFHTGSSDVKGVYGINVRVGLGGKPVQVEPFGNLRFDTRSKVPVVQEVREPVVDVLEEADHLLVVAEMPGIGAEDVKIELNDDVLTISAKGRGKKYYKEVLLPRVCQKEKMIVSCNTGIVEVKCPYA
jgi:HSP20 family protein